MGCALWCRSGHCMLHAIHLGITSVTRYTFEIVSSSAHEYLETAGMAPYTDLSSLGVE